MINQQAILTKAVKALIEFANIALERKQEPIRIARTVFSLLKAGCSSDISTFQIFADYLMQCQCLDGGWSGPDETVWALSVIRLVKGDNHPRLHSALDWLHSTRKASGGWGYNSRDKARIPTTALVAVMEPNILGTKDHNWLFNEWQKDFTSPVRLSYKAGFFLLSMTFGKACELVRRTITHLTEDQNDDGGFAPWRGHPIGSDPWSTGVVLWGLSRWGDSVDLDVFKRALEWLEKTQLPSGYWPYHYLDDGTSLALIGAVSAMKALAGTKA